MSQKLTVSVVVATYNGEKFIKEQLNSILNQSRTPDEVLIFDDCSTDSTREMIQNFLNANDLKGWKLYINNKNVGWKSNFLNGFNKAQCDVIFLCDQDDVWDKNKIKSMVEIMEKNQAINVLCCNLKPFIEENGRNDLPKYNLINYGKNELEQVKFGKMWMNPLRQGCTMCFRNQYVPIINKIWFPQCPHDLAVWALGMATNSLYIYNRSFVNFRRHNGNNSPANLKNRNNRCGLLNIYIKLAENIINLTKNSSNMAKMKEMDNFYKKRITAIEKRNPFLFARMLTQLYLYPQVRSYFGDIVSSFKK